MPPQQATTRPAPMEKIERMNAVVVRGTGQGVGTSPRRNSYVIEMDWGRNCYTCGGFVHMACHCRNWGQRERTAENRRVEYGGGRIKEINKQLNNLKEIENSESLD